MVFIQCKVKVLGNINNTDIFFGPDNGSFHAQVSISLTFWTFDILYGVDLWSALVDQTFESKVENWDDINILNTNFYGLRFGPELFNEKNQAIFEELIAMLTIDVLEFRKLKI